MSRQYSNTVPVLVVGGEPSFVKAKLGQTLQRHGLHVKAHWRWRRKRLPSTLPAVQAVYVVTDMCGHSLNDIAVTMAKKKGVPVIYGTRKWAESSQRIVAAGFPLTTRKLPAAVKEIVEMSTEMSTKATQSARPRGRPPSPHREARGAAYLAALEKDMTLSNVRAHEVAVDSEGIDVMGKSPKHALIKSAREALRVAKVPAVPTSLLQHVMEHVAAEKDSRKLPPSGGETPPAVVKAPQSDNGAPDWWEGDIVSALEMMREQMAAANVISIEITADSIRWKRAVVEEGVFNS